MTEKYSFTVTGNDLVDKVKELVHQGNIRTVHLICDEQSLIDIPLSIGAPAAAAAVLGAPLLAATAAIAALVKECTIDIEKVKEED